MTLVLRPCQSDEGFYKIGLVFLGLSSENFNNCRDTIINLSIMEVKFYFCKLGFLKHHISII